MYSELTATKMVGQEGRFFNNTIKVSEKLFHLNGSPGKKFLQVYFIKSTLFRHGTWNNFQKPHPKKTCNIYELVSKKVRMTITGLWPLGPLNILNGVTKLYTKMTITWSCYKFGHSSNTIMTFWELGYTGWRSLIQTTVSSFTRLQTILA